VCYGVLVWRCAVLCCCTATVLLQGVACQVPVAVQVAVCAPVATNWHNSPASLPAGDLRVARAYDFDQAVSPRAGYHTPDQSLFTFASGDKEEEVAAAGLRPGEERAEAGAHAEGQGEEEKEEGLLVSCGSVCCGSSGLPAGRTSADALDTPRQPYQAALWLQPATSWLLDVKPAGMLPAAPPAGVQPHP
jgi:hypothetical protein